MTSSANSESVTYAKASGVKTAAETGDRIEHVKLSLAFLPLATAICSFSSSRPAAWPSPRGKAYAPHCRILKTGAASSPARS